MKNKEKLSWYGASHFLWLTLHYPYPKIRHQQMTYKAIVLDLDGTLTNNKKEITPLTKEALMSAQRKGMRVILASGRPTYGIRPVADALSIGSYDGYVMAYNGGCVTKWADKTIIFNQTLDPALVPVLYKAAKDAPHHFEILTYQGESIAATNVNDEYVRHEAFINKMPLMQYDDFPNQVQPPINKCLIVGDPAPLALLEKELAETLQGKCGVYRSADFFLECVPCGIDKAASLSRLIKTLGIKREEVIAVGDGYNDISMIEYAGLGVAMANAASEVKTKADFVTLSNEEDGVAYVIKRCCK